MKRITFKRILALLVFLTVIMLIVGLGVVYSVYYTLPREMSRGDRLAFAAWKTKPLQFPREALEAQPYTTATIAAARELRRQFQLRQKSAEELLALYDKKSDRENLWESNHFSAPAEMRTAVEPLTAAYENLVHQPDYTTDAQTADLLLSDTDTRNAVAVPDYNTCNTINRVLMIQTMILMNENRMDEAWVKSRLIMEGAKQEPYGSMIARLTGISCHVIGSHAATHIVDRSQDARLLERMLKEQNDMARSISLIADSQDMTWDDIGYLRILKRRGWSGSFQGWTGWQLYSLNYRAQVEYLENVVLPYQQAHPDQYPTTLSTIEMMERMRKTANLLTPQPFQFNRDGVGKLIMRLTKMRDQELARIYFDGVKILRTVRTREQVMLAKFNLLRLQTARKLYRLREGHDAPSLAELVPQYLPEVLKDPFDKTGAPFRQNANKVDYSLGPDETDQQAQIIYDPSNGTTSAGDLFFK